MDESAFVHVQVDPGPAAPDGLTLRFKAAGTAERITRLTYEAEDGTDGWWDVASLDDTEGYARREAIAVLVEDSSEGTVRLIVGGVQGLLLIHRDTGRHERQPYLLLSAASPIA